MADSLNLQYMDYTEAVKQILENGTVKKLLSKDEVMEIGVIGPEGAQSSRILSNLEACAAEEKNARCYYASSEEVQRARQEGLSYGKYKAFLEIQALSPDITAEEVRGMTMREIRELIGRLSASRPEETGQQEKDDANPTAQAAETGPGRETETVKTGNPRFRKKENAPAAHCAPRRYKWWTVRNSNP